MFTALALAAALSAPVPKATAPDLKWRFAKGDTFYVTTAVDADTAVNAGPGVQAQGNTSAAVYVYKATVAAADDKSTTLEVEFLSCKSGSAAGAAVKLADDPTAAGKKVTFTLDAAHKVTKADGVAKLGTAGGIFGPEYVQGQVQDLFRAVPGQVLGKGDTWKGEEESPLADNIVVKRTDRGTVAGTEDGLTKLEVETDQAMVGGPKGGPAFDLKGEKGKRTVLFDPKAGRVRKVEEQYTVAGNVALALGGAGGGGGGPPPNISLSMTMKATVTVSDTPPKDGK
jgi:hypothetical protein